MDAQAWDRIAGAYFDEISTPFQAEVVNPLLDYLDGLPGREELAIADLGCGIGNLLPFLAERFKTVVAVDFSTNMLRTAQENCTHENVQFCRQSLTDLSVFQGQFDLVVTVALGSTLATIILSKDVPLVEGVAAMVLLVALQAGITWLSVRSPGFQDLVKSEPSLLFREGAFLSGTMRRQRITREEILAAIRSSGLPGPASVAAVVLETDGSMSVIPKAEAGSGDIPETERIDSRTVFDIVGEINVTRDASLFASVQNLTDEVYNVAWSPAGARPGLPRTFMAGIKVSF